MLLAWVQKHWPLVLAFSGGLKITGQNEIGQNLRAINCTLSLCGESNPNSTLVIVLCLEFFRNLNVRQSLHANTLPMGKAAKRKNRGQRVGEGRRANSKGHVTELSTASQEALPVAQLCVMSGRGWALRTVWMGQKGQGLYLSAPSHLLSLTGPASPYGLWTHLYFLVY